MRALLLSILIVVCACGQDSTAPTELESGDAGVIDPDVSEDAGLDLGDEILELRVSPDKVLVRVGASVPLQVEALTDSQIVPVVDATFEVDDDAIATVDERGIVSGIAPGETFVRVRWRGRQAFVVVEVRRPFLESFTILPRRVELGPGQSVELEVRSSADEEAYGPLEIDWTLDSDHASFDASTRTLRALRPGELTLIASAEGQRAEVAIEIRSQPSQLVAGESHFCARVVASVFCWGGNMVGQLGHEESGVGLVAGEFEHIAAGGQHTCGITPDGTRCWGANDGGQLGGDANFDGIVELDPSFEFESMAAGISHTCALDSSGSAYCWGSNDSGQLGVGDLEPRSSPTRVSLNIRFSAIAAGSRHTCAIDVEDDRLWCWGENQSGQLGRDDPKDVPEPSRVTSMNRYLAIHGGGEHTCAISSTQTPQCWGSNVFGQLGDGTTTDRNAPIFVSSPVG